MNSQENERAVAVTDRSVVRRAALAAIPGALAFSAAYLLVTLAASAPVDHALFRSLVASVLHAPLITVCQVAFDGHRPVLWSIGIATVLIVIWAALFSSSPDRWLDMAARIGGACASALVIALTRGRTGFAR